MKRALALIVALALLLMSVPALADKELIVYTSLEDADSDQISNIALAIAHLDRLTLDEGESFSFNDAIGPRTQQLGYCAAMNGRGAVVTGGGVEQVASTLNMAAERLSDMIVIDEAHSYGSRFVGAYVQDGSDAILVDYASGIDYAFTSLAPQLTIEMWIANDELCCCLSVPEDEFVFLDFGAAPADLREPIATSVIDLANDDAIINNITLAAGSINDTLLLPGDLFSFNEVVGPRIERCGYRTAVNGRGVKVVGGGVAQVASALWLAVQSLDCVAVVEKSTYGKRYNQAYVESSNDAILTDYNEGTDFSFRNIGPTPILISTTLTPTSLVCSIYSE